jgi:hypothetical protein
MKILIYKKLTAIDSVKERKLVGLVLHASFKRRLFSGKRQTNTS